VGLGMSGWSPENEIFAANSLQCLFFLHQWVYNILEGKSEAERGSHHHSRCNDPDPENGFVLLPDMKWEQQDHESLYLLAITHQRGILSMRELTAKRLALLKKVLHSGKVCVRRVWVGGVSGKLETCYPYPTKFSPLRFFW